MQKELAEMQQVLHSHRAFCGKDFGELPSVDSHSQQQQQPVYMAVISHNEALTMPPPPVQNAMPSITVTVDGPPPKKLRPSLRPDSLPVHNPIGLSALAMPTPSPSKLHFNFDHSGLTPTGKKFGGKKVNIVKKMRETFVCAELFSLLQLNPNRI